MIDSVKSRLYAVMQKDQPVGKIASNDDQGNTSPQSVGKDILSLVSPERRPAIQKALKYLKNPRTALERLRQLVAELVTMLRTRLQCDTYVSPPMPFDTTVDAASKLPQVLTPTLVAVEPQQHLYNNELLSHMFERWRKLESDLWSKKKGKYDLSKLPDIYDCIKYDVLHNKWMLFGRLGSAGSPGGSTGSSTSSSTGGEQGEQGEQGSEEQGLADQGGDSTDNMTKGEKMVAVVI
jgi:hypothetical protein